MNDITEPLDTAHRCRPPKQQMSTSDSYVCIIAVLMPDIHLLADHVYQKGPLCG